MFRKGAIISYNPNNMKNACFTTLVLAINIIVMGCGRNNKSLSITDSIDLDEWNAETMHLMTEKLHLDLILSEYWKNDSPPMISITDHKPINDYKEEILSFLSFRKGIIQTLKNESDILQDKSFYIIEFQDYTHTGFTQSFSIVSDTLTSYHYQYNPDKACFIRKKTTDPVYIEEQPLFHSNIDEMSVMTGLKIVTYIFLSSDNKIHYQFKELSVW